MKKSKIGILGSLLVLTMILGQIGSVQGTTYTCTGVVGAEAIWKVKTVHPGALSEIFGASPTWEISIQTSFGPGSHQQGARMKSKVTFVNSSYEYNFGLGSFELCLINSSVWLWTTHPFAVSPNITDSPSTIMMHPENLTYYCQIVGAPNNVSYAVAWSFLDSNFVNFLSALPIPVATFLSELVWDDDYSISGTTVTHNVVAPYTGFVGITYSVDCVETWRYSSSYGTFLGYKLVHNNGTVAYETELELGEAAIPGYEFSIIVGVSTASILGIIIVLMKKRQ
ncbi:MAG: hypothetical protein ACFE9Z_11370 [Promethearchaeota archaeon]